MIQLYLYKFLHCFLLWFISGYGILFSVPYSRSLLITHSIYKSLCLHSLFSTNSGSSAFSKTSLNVWKFTLHVLLKPGLKNFEHYFTSTWDEWNCAVVWALPFFGIGMKIDLFQSCGHCGLCQICWHILCSTFTASSFRIWNSSTWIPSPPLALFIVMLPKAHLTSDSRMSGSIWVITPSWLSGSWKSV